ncbi:hypothetical protein FSARC_14560 [Fusarium sarcochroum]|uniref:RRM domain-containing protein n=1 Tax=Fusarium sarcochroum TaxID=1208366 RepID=A0A8H4SS92_9HYPO|nr:hypothetical protein FSARC_14560 [Fusarium sarcochroum]
MAVKNPNTSSQPEPESPGSRSMSRLEIGLMVGAILFFAILISSIFLVRGLEQRRRVKGLLRRVEEGNAESKDQHQTPQENNITEQGQQESVEIRRLRLRAPNPQWLRARHPEAVTGRAHVRLRPGLSTPAHPSAAIIMIRDRLLDPQRPRVAMAVTGVEAAAPVGVEAAAGVIVVERLSKNINEQHLQEIFGQFGRIKDLDLPLNRTFGTNRGTAYILYDYEADAETAIAHMHEAQVDGSAINVSIVLPRRKLSPAPPTARRGANIDPRVPFAGARGGPPSAGMGGNTGMGGGGRHRTSPGDHLLVHLLLVVLGVDTAVDPIIRMLQGHDRGPQGPSGKELVDTTTTRRDAAAATMVLKTEVDLAAEDAARNERRAARCN